LGGQFDGLPASDMPPPPSPVGATTVIQTGGTVVTGPIGTSTSIEYRDILAFIDAKSTNNRRQRILRPLTVQRPSFTPHLIPLLNEPVALVTWTDTADVVPIWRAGGETRVNLAGTIVNLTGDDLSIIRMDVYPMADGVVIEVVEPAATNRFQPRARRSHPPQPSRKSATPGRPLPTSTPADTLST
jgi:hypothetical protein